MPTKQSQSGFTLVELLVVISILGVLSVVGVTVYSGVQKKIQDTKVRADVDAFVKAYELKFNVATGEYPATISEEAFTGGVPKKPDKSLYRGCDNSTGVVSCNLLNGNTDKPFEICAKLSGGEEYCKKSGQPTATNQTAPTKVVIADLSS